MAASWAIRERRIRDASLISVATALAQVIVDMQQTTLTFNHLVEALLRSIVVLLDIAKG